MHIDLADKVAIVTGGSRGIGRAIALELAASGASVVVNYRTGATEADAVVAQITEAGGKAVAFQADVSDSTTIEPLIKAATDTFGGLHILVNNAGIARDNLLMRMKDDEWDAVIDTNLRGAFLLTRAAMRPMMRARWGRVITITSVIGLIGNAGQSNYAAAKAGLIGFTKSVAREMASRGITANAIAPGFVDTAITATLNETQREAIMASIPLGRWGQTEDIARTVTFLASDAAGYITGQTLAVDGGMTMQ